MLLFFSLSLVYNYYVTPFVVFKSTIFVRYFSRSNDGVE